MVITFVSNYINHHQLPFCKEMSSQIDDVEFYFIQTMPMEEKRKNMGWGLDEKSLPFVVLYYEQKERAKELIRESDVVLFGWTEGIISDDRSLRLSSGKLSFCVSERIYREGQWKMISPRGLKNKYNEHIRFKSNPVYLLCTGAYVASDFALIGAYPGKMLKWGYFPQIPQCEENVPDKRGGTLKLCWAGRLIELKHPEFAIKVAAFLKGAGFDFVLDIIGDGPMRQDLEKKVLEEKLKEHVNLLGNKKPGEVLDHMKGSDIFLFTSNYLEGWGAVVNEAMGCGCAVVASNEAGAVPFLIQDKENGLIYDHGSYEDFEEKVRYLFENRDEITRLGNSARATIEDVWNAKYAAKELIRFCREFLDGKGATPSKKGPMSPAPVLKAPGFIRTLEEKNRLE